MIESKRDAGYGVADSVDFERLLVVGSKVRWVRLRVQLADCRHRVTS
jgi:hypothetical protein